MKNKLFIIGNGFDLAHNLPTKYDPDFKNITKKYEYENFWDMYQTREANIWSDFENLLAYPDFNELEAIFNGYTPDYSSDRESDRDGIITQVDINGQLYEALYEFANNAEKRIEDTDKNKNIEKIIDRQSYYISFNYTHTLEKIYNISTENILHVHGEIGKNNLVIGYPKENFCPEIYSYDVRAKGIGPYSKMKIEDYIDTIEDTYIWSAYNRLLKKCKSFNKEAKLDLVKNFLDNIKGEINEIIVFGHSCAIDYSYFDFINKRYPDARWLFYTKGNKQNKEVCNLISKYNIDDYSIIPIE